MDTDGGDDGHRFPVTADVHVKSALYSPLPLIMVQSDGARRMCGYRTEGERDKESYFLDVLSVAKLPPWPKRRGVV